LAVFRTGAGFLRDDDPDTSTPIAPRWRAGRNITINLSGESVELTGRLSIDSAGLRVETCRNG